MIRILPKLKELRLVGVFFFFVTVSLAFAWPASLNADPVKKILYVYGVTNDDLKDNDENYERMVSTLEGIGIPYDKLNFNQLGTATLTNYQLVVVAWSSSFWMNHVPDITEQKIIDSINQGVHFLWIGPGIWGKQTNSQLPQAFGLTYVGYNNTHGINYAEFADLAGTLTKTRVKNVAPNREYIVRVNMPQASAEGSYYIDAALQSFPFITSYQAAPEKGKTIFISMNIMDWWKETEAEDTYARTEVLVKYIRKLTNQSYVAKHSVKNGKEATFLLRLEDYTPGGDMMLGNPLEPWIDRLDNLIYFLKNTGLKLNMAVIPRYAHPCLGESHSWSDADQGIPLLKRYAQTVLADGGSLIAHGYKHQVGIGQEDFSGGDYEMCLFPTDQTSCDLRPNVCYDPFDPLKNTFLSYADQKDRTDSARTEMATQFNFTPLIWETPHYAGNQDTYRAAADSGFQFFTESDTMLFPNYFGYLNRAQGLIMNIPETAFDFQDNPTLIAQMEPIKKDFILPRLVRLNAPYYAFYHNTNLDQYKSLVSVINKAWTYDLWYPSAEEFGMFWKSRGNASVSDDFNPALKKITANVANAFAGLTLTFRLPEGASPGPVFINGLPVGSINKLVDRVQLVYMVLPAGTAATVEVNYN
jgi:hypothetical protein